MLNLAILLEDSAREVPDRTTIIFEETREDHVAEDHDRSTKKNARPVSILSSSAACWHAS